ncbi:MAG: hypothetical protein K6E60_02460 [Saccharofermentans sp.]|nr:hypothetical protein [Saccharofermentans sp.]
MSNWGKSNLEIAPAPEMTIIDENGNITLLIKHDYYSSDSDHGRILLAAFLDSLIECGNKLAKVILIDSAVNLLNDVSFAQKIEKLFTLSKSAFVCKESLTYFGVEYVSHGNIIVCPASDISMEIINAGRLIIIQ